MDSDSKIVPIRKSTAAAAPKSKRKIGRPTRSNQELLDTALELFLQNGFERTSMDAIIASAGMAKRTIYSRYEDKAGLFNATLRHAIDQGIVPVEQLKSLESDDLEETLTRIALAHLDKIMSPAGLRLMRLAGAESGRMPKIGEYAVNRGTAQTVAMLADLFRRRASVDLSPEQRQVAASAFMQLTVGGPANMALWGLPLEHGKLEALVRRYVSLFLEGLLPRSAARTRAGKSTARKPLIDTPADTEQLDALKDENRRLKLLLADAMLDLARHENRHE